MLFGIQNLWDNFPQYGLKAVNEISTPIKHRGGKQPSNDFRSCELATSADDKNTEEGRGEGCPFVGSFTTFFFFSFFLPKPPPHEVLRIRINKPKKFEVAGLSLSLFVHSYEKWHAKECFRGGSKEVSLASSFAFEEWKRKGNDEEFVSNRKRFMSFVEKFMLHNLRPKRR